MSFSDDLKLILSFEGGYVNDPDDSGGATNKGITQKTYDDYLKSSGRSSIDVKDINDKDVEDIYYGYYKDCGADKIVTINPKLATQLFDFAINAGSTQAIKTLQRSVGVYADGIMGSQTLLAIQNSYFKLGASAQVIVYAYMRITFYASLCEQKPKNTKFLLSWITRTLAINAVP